MFIIVERIINRGGRHEKAFRARACRSPRAHRVPPRARRAGAARREDKRWPYSRHFHGLSQRRTCRLGLRRPRAHAVAWRMLKRG